MKQFLLIIFSLCCLSQISSQTECTDTIFFRFEQEVIEDFLFVHFVANEDMSDVAALQGGINFTVQKLQYFGVESDFLPPPFSPGNVSNMGDLLTFLWFDNTGVSPIEINEGDTLFSLQFLAIADGFVEFSMENDFIDNVISTSSSSFCIDAIYHSFTVVAPENDCVKLTFENQSDQTNILVDMIAEDFDNIVSIQFSIRYDPTVLAFDTMISDNLTEFGIANYSNNTPGIITISYSLGSTLPWSLVDGSSFAQIAFEALDNVTSDIYIDSNPLVIEVIDENFEERCLQTSSLGVVAEGAYIHGHVFFDENENCIDDNEVTLPYRTIQFDDGNNIYLTNSRSDGTFGKLIPEGSYAVSILSDDELWTSECNSAQTPNLVIGDSYEVEIVSQAAVYCQQYSVGVSTPFLRRCFDNTYYVDFCNIGTLYEDNVYVEVVLDDDLSFVSTGHDNYDINGQNITFYLDPLSIGACGSLSFVAYLDCDNTVLGQTHCVEATIFPNEPCIGTLDGNWSLASLDIESECSSDEVIFRIKNTGNGDMNEVQEFIVIEDDVMRPVTDDEVELDANGERVVSFPANGSTYRLSIPQVPFHPGFSQPTLAYEGCGANEQGAISLGFVTMFSEDDENQFVDIDCQESIGSYDPNDKNASPKGYRDLHQIKANTNLEYTIRFQNTGTDTAFNIFIIDTISNNLDLSSLKPLVASHPFEYTISEDRTVLFEFNDIQLLDSTSNEAASHGFVRFNIAQVPDLEPGTFIFNEADIYFDFNDPIRTNLVDHMIEIDFIEVITGNADLFIDDFSVKTFPNPCDASFVLETSLLDDKALALKIRNITGQEVLQTRLTDTSQLIDVNHLARGIYIGQIVDENKAIASFKINIQ